MEMISRIVPQDQSLISLECLEVCWCMCWE